MSWALFAAAFAAIQYLAFSMIPGAFFVDADYGRLASPRYQREWLRDSTRAGETLERLRTAERVLGTHGPDGLAPNTPYPLPGGILLTIRAQCEVLLAGDSCPWQLVLDPASGARVTSLAIEIPPESQQLIPRRIVEQEIEEPEILLEQHTSQRMVHAMARALRKTGKPRIPGLASRAIPRPSRANPPSAPA